MNECRCQAVGRALTAGDRTAMATNATIFRLSEEVLFSLATQEGCHLPAGGQAQTQLEAAVEAFSQSFSTVCVKSSDDPAAEFVEGNGALARGIAAIVIFVVSAVGGEDGVHNMHLRLHM